jgi:hypothetical protein
VYPTRQSQPAMQMSASEASTPPSGASVLHGSSAGCTELPLPPPPQFNVSGSGSGQAHPFNSPGSGSGQAHPFNSPGSGSGPAIPAMGVASTKLGYTSGAMGRSDISYPRYEVPIDHLGPDMQLTPNRRPLFIGIGIVAAGIIVMLIVSMSGGDETPSAAPVTEPEQATETDNAPAPDETAKGSDDSEAIDDNMVSVIIHSEPAGADVLIAGAKLGITPFENKLKRGTKIAPLTVQKDGYAPFNGKIDLGGEYENRNIKLIRLEDLPKGSDSAPLPGADKGSADTTKSGTDKTSKTGTDKTGADKTGADKVGSDKTATTKAATEKTGTEKTGTDKTVKTGTDKTVTTTKTATDKTSTTTKTGTGTKTNSDKTRPDKTSTKTSSDTAPKVEEKKCQPPGPNVDPFGLPVCKT